MTTKGISNQGEGYSGSEATSLSVHPQGWTVQPIVPLEGVSVTVELLRWPHIPRWCLTLHARDSRTNALAAALSVPSLDVTTPDDAIHHALTLAHKTLRELLDPDPF